jgi:hypothetical protein
MGLLERGLPPGVPAVIVHGTRDTVVAPDDSRRLAATGSPGMVLHVEVDDGHRLGSLMRTGRLARLVYAAATLAAPTSTEPVPACGSTARAGARDGHPAVECQLADRRR